MRSANYNIDAVPGIAPGLYSDDAPGVTVDRLSYESVTFLINLGVGGISFTATNRIDFIMEHSDDGTTWEAVDASNVTGVEGVTGGIIHSQRSAHPKPDVYRFGYIDGTNGEKRYVRVRADFNGTHGTGTPFSVTALTGKGRYRPITT
ncbi:hypothetical protein AB4Y85_18090 [Microvirga sp. 2YAF29]|uniref:hypothetical protein n=1 Tax=Microvirga sp. 2YAF29 TaxID=3233031 RepID=UPI003F9D6526